MATRHRIRFRTIIKYKIKKIVKRNKQGGSIYDHEAMAIVRLWSGPHA